MYTPHTVTIYNLRENANFETESNITILRGVFLDISQGANISKISSGGFGEKHGHPPYRSLVYIAYSPA